MSATHIPGAAVYLILDMAATIAAMEALTRAVPRAAGGVTLNMHHDIYLPWKAEAR